MTHNNYYAKHRERILQESKLIRELYKKHKLEYTLFKENFRKYYIQEKLKLAQIQVNFDVSFE